MPSNLVNQAIIITAAEADKGAKLEEPLNQNVFCSQGVSPQSTNNHEHRLSILSDIIESNNIILGVSQYSIYMCNEWISLLHSYWSIACCVTNNMDIIMAY